MLPPEATAASFVPSSEDVMDLHFLATPVLVTSVHAAPLLADVQMLPVLTTAASFVPSSEDVMENQFLV